MSDQDTRSTEHLDAETLAAFLDGRVDAVERARIEGHLAECEACYEVFVDATAVMGEMAEEVVPASAPATAPLPIPTPVRVQPGPRRWSVGALAAAAVAIISVGVAYQWFTRTPDLRELVTAVGSNRPLEARLSGGFLWGPPPAVLRAPESTPNVSAETQIAVAHIDQRVQADRSPRNLGRQGVGKAVEGKLDEAVVALEEASTLQRDDAEIWSNFAAVLLARSRQRGHADDVPHALDAAENALRISPQLPEALFNHALALERLSQREPAAVAWRAFLAVDSTSKWADEARQHLNGLGGLSATGPDNQVGREKLYDVVLPKWARAVSSDRAAALAARAEATALVAALSASTDHMARDVLELVDAADVGAAAPRQTLADGHRAYGDGRVAYDHGVFPAAAAAFARAEPLLAVAHSPLALWAHINGALAEYRQQHLPVASTMLADVASAIDGRPYPSIRGRVNWLQGLIAIGAGHHDEASRHYDDAIEAFSTAVEPANVGFIQGLIAEELTLVGEPVQAWERRLQALSASNKYGTLLNAARAARDEGLLLAAETLARAAVAQAGTSANPGDLVDASRAQSLIAARAGRYAVARETLGRARASLTSRNALTDRIAAELDAAEAVAGDPDHLDDDRAAATRALAYFTASKTWARLPDLYLAIERAERLAGHMAAADAALDQGWHALDSQRASISSPLTRSTFKDQLRRLSDEQVELRLAAHDEFAAFDAMERGRTEMDLTEGQPADALSLPTLRAAMSDHSLVAYHEVHEDSVLIATVSRSTFRIARSVCPRWRLESLIRQFSKNDGSSPIGAELRRLLIDPIDLPNSTTLIAIVPDGPLNLLAFAAVPGREGRFMIEQQAILLAPNARSLLISSRHLASLDTLPTDITAFGIATTDKSTFPNLPDLPEAESEADAAATPYLHRASVKGEDVTRARLVSALDTSEVIHFAGHAVIDDVNPDASMLVLGRPGANAGLTAADIEHVQMANTRLVVLAACNSAGGRLTRSDGPLSLARAFLAVGVPSVVASRAVVADRASKALFTAFHKAFAASGDAPTALRDAQLSLLRASDPSLNLPSRWAPFVAIGGSRVLVSR